jgi:hypothetical protein
VPEAQGEQGINAAHSHCIVHRKRAGFGAQLPRSWRTAAQSKTKSRYDLRNAQKYTRTGKNKPERIKTPKELQKTNKKRKQRQMNLPTRKIVLSIS